MLDCVTTDSVCMYTRFVALVRKIESICRNNFLSFLCFTLTENVMNCFAINLLPPKRRMTLFRGQIELRVAPYERMD